MRRGPCDVDCWFPFVIFSSETVVSLKIARVVRRRPSSRRQRFITIIITTIMRYIMNYATKRDKNGGEGSIFISFSYHDDEFVVFIGAELLNYL